MQNEERKMQSEATGLAETTGKWRFRRKRPPQCPKWRSFGFLACVLAIFLLQVALIYMLSSRSTPKPRAARPIPTIRLAGTESATRQLPAAEPGTREGFDKAVAAARNGDYTEAAGRLQTLSSNATLTTEQRRIVENLLARVQEERVLALLNPALFALPNADSFSGEAWMRSPPMEYRAFDWNDVPRWLPLNLQPLNTVLAGFGAGRNAPGQPLAPWPAPELNEPGMLRLQFLPAASEMEVFSSDPEIISTASVTLTNWAYSDLLTNSVVQVMVNDEGKALSVTLLGGGSGLKEADDYALKKARELAYRPNPVKKEKAAPWETTRWAQLVFEWRTVALPAGTNSGGAS